MNVPPFAMSEMPKGVFKQVCVLFLPGVLVVIPAFVLIYLYSNQSNATQLVTYFEKHYILLYSIGIILSFIMGFMLENMGSCIEKHLDKCCSVTLEVWRAYLLKEESTDKRIIIYEYIDSVLFRYAMELSLIPAILIFLIELVCVNISGDNIFHPQIFWAIFIVTLLSLMFTICQAKISCEVLDSLRKDLVFENGICPCCKKKISKNLCQLCEQSIETKD